MFCFFCFIIFFQQNIFFLISLHYYTFLFFHSPKSLCFRSVDREKNWKKKKKKSCSKSKKAKKKTSRHWPTFTALGSILDGVPWNGKRSEPSITNQQGWSTSNQHRSHPKKQQFNSTLPPWLRKHTLKKADLSISGWGYLSAIG